MYCPKLNYNKFEYWDLLPAELRDKITRDAVFLNIKKGIEEHFKRRWLYITTISLGGNTWGFKIGKRACLYFYPYRWERNKYTYREEICPYNGCLAKNLVPDWHINGYVDGVGYSYICQKCQSFVPRMVPY